MTGGRASYHWNNKLSRILQRKPTRSHTVELYKIYYTLPVQLLHNFASRLRALGPLTCSIIRSLTWGVKTNAIHRTCIVVWRQVVVALNMSVLTDKDRRCGQWRHRGGRTGSSILRTYSLPVEGAVAVGKQLMLFTCCRICRYFPQYAVDWRNL